MEDKSFCIEWKQEFSNFKHFLSSSWIEFWCVKVVQKCLDSSNI